MKCTSCGAPLNSGDETCPYCGTSTPYGEKASEARMKDKLLHELKEQEDERRKHDERRLREDKARFKYVNVLFMPLFYACTFMLYGPYWYISRSYALNNLSDDKGKKLNKWLCVFYALLCIAVFVFPDEAEKHGITKETASNYWVMALFFAVGLSVWLAFRVREILKDYAGGFRNNFLGLPFDPFAVLLFVIGPVYLQFEVNRLIKRGLLKPKI